jgi:hypothetical protein
MVLDSLVANQSSIGETIGNFHGTPIKQYFITEPHATEEQEAQQRVSDSYALLEEHGLEAWKNADGDTLQITQAYVLDPNEVVCDDRIVRRTTASEYLGDEYRGYTDEAGSRRTDLKEAQQLVDAPGTLVHWRPNGVCSREEEYALALYEDTE